MSKTSVNVVSESAFTVQGHGVHTAFEEHVHALKSYTGLDIRVNSKRAADIVHVHTIGPYSWRKFRLAKHGKVINAHVTPGSFIGSLRAAKLWAPIARSYLKFVYSRADHIICVSPQTALELKSLGLTTPMSVIPNMIELSSFRRPPKEELKTLKLRYKIPSNKPVIIAAGQVQPRKGIEDFRLVAKSLSNYHFLWIGGIPFGKIADQAKSMQRAMETAPSNVSFTGVVDLETARKLYHLGDIFWLPSYQETFGLVVIEAAACKLPVILRDIPVYKDIFKGSYLSAKSNSGFIKHIEALLKNKPLYINQQKLSVLLAKKYASSTLIHRYEKLYNELIAQKK